MKCYSCAYENNCSLKEIAIDITGCEGHSSLREAKDNEVKCYCCGNWTYDTKIIQFEKDLYLNRYLCIECYKFQNK